MFVRRANFLQTTWNKKYGFWQKPEARRWAGLSVDSGEGVFGGEHCLVSANAKEYRKLSSRQKKARLWAGLKGILQRSSATLHSVL